MSSSSGSTGIGYSFAERSVVPWCHGRSSGAVARPGIRTHEYRGLYHPCLRPATAEVIIVSHMRPFRLLGIVLVFSLAAGPVAAGQKAAAGPPPDTAGYYFL